MGSFGSAALRLSRLMNYVGGAVLVLMMLLTVSDVILRIFWKPILGTYEMVSLAGAMVIGFALPKTSFDDAHVYVDFLTAKSQGVRRAFLVVTKFFGFVLFLLLAVNMLLKAGELYRAQEVTLTLQVPIYPVAYALGLCSVVEAVVLLMQMLQNAGIGGRP